MKQFGRLEPQSSSEVVRLLSISSLLLLCNSIPGDIYRELEPRVLGLMKPALNPDLTDELSSVKSWFPPRLSPCGGAEGRLRGRRV